MPCGGLCPWPTFHASVTKTKNGNSGAPMMVPITIICSITHYIHLSLLHTKNLEFLTLTFDLLLKNLTLDMYNFLTKRNGAFISHVCISWGKTILLVPKILTLTLTFDLLLKKLNFGINFPTERDRPSNEAWTFLVARPFCPYQNCCPLPWPLTFTDFWKNLPLNRKRSYEVTQGSHSPWKVLKFWVFLEKSLKMNLSFKSPWI